MDSVVSNRDKQGRNYLVGVRNAMEVVVEKESAAKLQILTNRLNPSVFLVSIIDCRFKPTQKFIFFF